jgi:hypothetical protein
MTFGLYLLLTLLLFLLFGLWVRNLIVKRLAPERILGDLGDEVQRLIADFNATSDHNISILEDRITQLRDMVTRADREIEELQDALERAEGVLERAAAAASESEPANPDAHAESVEYEAGGETRAPVEYPVAGELDAPRRLHTAPSADDSVVHLRLSDRHHDTPPDATERLSARDHVLLLHAQGLSPEIVAQRVGMAIGEVELIISLAGGWQR